MANATDKERATQNRLTGEGSRKRPHVVLVPGTRGGFEAVIVQPPDEVVFEEERPITPGREFRSQEVRRQAGSVLSQAARGQHFKDDYLGKLQQQLLKSGGADGNDLAGAVEQLRASQRARDEARMTAAANRKQDANAKGLQGPAQPEGDSPGKTLPPPEKPPDEEFPGANLNAVLAGIGLVRRQAEARGLANRFAQGEEISAREARRTASRAVEAIRHAGEYGLESEGLGQVIQLGEIQLSQLQKAVEDIEGRKTKGGRVGRKQFAYLGQGALGMERQYQLLGVVGPESRGVGLDLAMRLADLERAQLENDVNDVFDRAKRSEPSGRVYLDYLQRNLLAAERQEQLLGRGSSDRAERAMSLGKLQTVPMNQEARQVIDGLARGQDFDDAYLETLRRQLVEDFQRTDNRESRTLADQLRDAQASRLESEVRKVLNDAKAGKRFPEFYLTYLQQRIDDMNAEDKNEERKARSKKLASSLDDLIR